MLVLVSTSNRKRFFPGLLSDSDCLDVVFVSISIAFRCQPVSWVDLNYVILFFILFSFCKFPQAEGENRIRTFYTGIWHYDITFCFTYSDRYDDDDFDGSWGGHTVQPYNPNNKFSYTIRVYGIKGNFVCWDCGCVFP